MLSLSSVHIRNVHPCCGPEKAGCHSHEWLVESDPNAICHHPHRAADNVAPTECSLFLACSSFVSCPTLFQPVARVAPSGTRSSSGVLVGASLFEHHIQQALVGSNWRPGTHLIPAGLQFQPTNNQPECRQRLSWSPFGPPAREGQG